jgi:hypothetical protein
MTRTILSKVAGVHNRFEALVELSASSAAAADVALYLATSGAQPE